ncbi:3793_t:CDS:2, partial [Scutellospora calospora]
GGQSLDATAIRRNKERNPNDRARIGFKVDAAMEYQNLSWTPVIGCLKVSGGLPRCSRSKEWDDTLKLGLELRDLWAVAEDQLKGTDVDKLVWWDLTVVGRKIRVYAFAASGGLFRIQEEAKNMLCEFSRKKVQMITRKRDLEESAENILTKKPKIVDTPIRDARNRRN